MKPLDVLTVGMLTAVLRCLAMCRRGENPNIVVI